MSVPEVAIQNTGTGPNALTSTSMPVSRAPVVAKMTVRIAKYV